MEGARIRKLRHSLGWSQETLADFLAFPGGNYVSKLERNLKRMSALARLCLLTLERVVERTPPDLRRTLWRRTRTEEHEVWFGRVLGRANEQR